MSRWVTSYQTIEASTTEYMETWQSEGIIRTLLANGTRYSSYCARRYTGHSDPTCLLSTEAHSAKDMINK